MTGINQQPSATSTARPGIGEYLLSMSPQIRAPLNAVIGMSGLLLDDDLSEQQRQYVKTLHAAGEARGDHSGVAARPPKKLIRFCPLPSRFMT